MATSTLPESLAFLNDAAHLLATTAPETSAYIMSRRNVLMFNNELHPTDVQRQHVCGSCGHIMIPGQGSLLNFEAQKIIRKKNRKMQKVESKDTQEGNRRLSKVYTCGRCQQHTTIALPPAPKIPRRNFMSSAGKSTLPAGRPAEAEPSKLSANASSKKRAKNRKQGLQALLQQNQSTTTKSGLGLSLADFMKK